MSAIKPIGTAPDHDPNQEWDGGQEIEKKAEQFPKHCADHETSAEAEVVEGMEAGISNWDYHHNPKYGALSASGIKSLLRSPAHFKISRENHAQTPSMIFGSAAHSYILQPELNEVIVTPEINRRTNEGKEAHEKFLKENEKKIVIGPQEFEIINAMRDVLLENETAQMILHKGTPELSAFWQHEIHKFLCKCRPDFLVDDLNIIVDYKTCQDAGLDEFGRAAFNLGYHIQAAWYKEGIEQITAKDWNFVFIAQEKTEPFAVGIYKVPDKILAKGQAELALATHIYNECLKTNKWRGYPDRIQQLEFPAWAFK